MRRRGTHRVYPLRVSGQRAKLSVCAGLSPILLCVLVAAENWNYSIQTWQTAEGLPQDSVNSIIQTPDGYLWLATFNGLARFDGARFTVFDEGNTPALQNSRLVRLDLDQDGRLWIIGQDGSLTRFAHGRFKSFTAAQGVPAAGAAAVVRGPGRRLLLLGRDAAIYDLQAESWVRDPRFKLRANMPASLHTDQNDQLWAWIRGTGAFGPVLQDRLVAIKTQDGAADVRVRAFAARRDGGYWLVLSNRVWICRMDLPAKGGEQSSGSAAVIEPSQWVLPDSARALTQLLEDLEGNLWVATWGHGLFCFSPSGSCRHFGITEGLSHEVVRALWLDREGSLWVGTDGGGLNHFRRRVMNMFDARHGLSGNVVMSVLQDRLDRAKVWVGLNSGGLVTIRGNQIAPVLAEPLLSTNSMVYGLFQTRQGELWIGTYSEGVLRHEDGNTSALAQGPDWSGRPLRAALESRSGVIWAGGAGGLLEWNGNSFVNHNAELGCSNVTVSSLVEDAAGTFYVGTYGQGLFRQTTVARTGDRSSPPVRSEHGWIQYAEKNGLPDNHITCMYIDRRNRLWIGSFNRGLSLFRQDSFLSLDSSKGLPDNSIAGIVEDGAGNIWLGCNRGIFRIPKGQADEFATGRRPQVTGSSLGLSEGLSTLECSAACAGSDGNLWFATPKGLATLDPARLPQNPVPPPVLIEEVLADGRSCPPQSPEARDSAPLVVVPPRRSRVEFRFTGLSFLAPEKVRFRYCLRHFDEQWVEAGTQRMAYYTRLPAGRYKFEVTACNNDGVWNTQGASLDVLVLPPWWMTWWAQALGVLGTAALVFWILESRLRRIRREHAMQSAFSRRLMQTQEEERKRIAAELHDSLGQDLLVIKNRALLGLRETGANPAEQLTEISRMASDSLAEVRRISHDLRPYQIDRLGLTKALQLMVTSVSSASGVPCEARFEPLDGLLPESLQIHCYRIVQELLNNVVKHSHASRAHLAASVQDHRIVLLLEDDGCGFDPALQQSRGVGAGLTDVAERARILGGAVHCDSKPAQGTRWTVEIPVNIGCQTPVGASKARTPTGTYTPPRP